MNKDLSTYKKEASKGMLCIFFYIFLASFLISFLKLFNIDYNELSKRVKIICILLTEIITMCSILLVMNKKVTRDFKDIVKNHKTYFKKYFKYWLIAVGIMIMSNMIIGMIMGGNDVSGNEKVIRDTFKISPLYIFITSVIIAPITEEMIFRQSIRNIIPNKILFILVSGLIFGALHIVTGFRGPLDLLYLIPYCAPGFAFAYILADSDNIWISTSLHLMHNGILVALQFMTLIFM